MLGEVYRPFVGSRGASFSMAVCLFRLRVMRINIPNKKRHFVVAEEVRDRCVVTTAATVTWQNVDVEDVQLLATGYRNPNAWLL